MPHLPLNRDMSDASLQYLSSEQALADLATFIVGMNEKYDLTSKNKWISFGGSYPGALSAWLKLKYPHLVSGKISFPCLILLVPFLTLAYQIVSYHSLLVFPL